MARGKGRVKEFNLEDELNSHLLPSEELNDIDDDTDSEHIVLIDAEGLYGFQTYKYGYALMSRRRFDTDTLIEKIIPRTGEIKKEFYKKGDFSPWAPSPYTYHSRLDFLLKRAFQLAIKDKVATLKDLTNVVSIIEETEKRFERYLSSKI